MGVVQDVEFADVDVEGRGQGNKVQKQSRFKKIISQFPSGWEKGRFYRLEAVCALISRDVSQTVGGCLESIIWDRGIKCVRACAEG